jgi:hypothetical protein
MRLAVLVEPHFRALNLAHLKPRDLHNVLRCPTFGLANLQFGPRWTMMLLGFAGIDRVTYVLRELPCKTGLVRLARAYFCCAKNQTVICFDKSAGKTVRGCHSC